ncbi:polyketide synthase [Aspergillus niger ATCC 13496]|uniref:Polyketide synthase n=1 Tax=Aspergillus niger ATCC 13496 TaxID=1353008 RepID=A0A370BTW1_ASPNG|nr:polyketide synthase [Aspergillus niger CBS 513.88]RDH18927.1 polyketide synthase [Aspergillus niger ATCC 13496]|eukprot:XP_001393524.2 polyketide synthase [Aspergillus niger CBS 513.88]
MATDELIHRINWSPAALSKEPLSIAHVVFVLTDKESEILSAYQTQLAHEGITTVVIDDAIQIDSLITPKSIVVYIPPTAKRKDDIYAAATQACTGLINVAQQLYHRSISAKSEAIKLFSIVSKSWDICNLAHSPLHGLSRVLKTEIPEIFGGLFEDDCGCFPLSAVKYAQGFDVVKICEGEAQIASLQPFANEPDDLKGLQLDAKSTYLITGGTGGIGLATATWLAQHGARNLVLVSRRGLPLNGDSKPVASSSADLVSRIAKLKALGVSVHLVAVDLSKPNADVTLGQAVNDLHIPPIKGVIHAAGIAGYRTLIQCTPSDIAEHLAPKVMGSLNLDSLFPPGTLDFFIFTSSVGQLVGFPGQLAYAPSNSFLDALAAHRRRQGDNSMSILWAGWQGVGVWDQSKSAMRRLTKASISRGIADIRPDEAFAAWEHIASRDTDHAVVVRVLELAADESVRHPMLKDITPRKQVYLPTTMDYKDYPEHAIAVIGMACRTAAGNTENDLWEAIQAGKSIVREVDEKRFPGVVRDGTMWGSFMSDIDSFDHQFFQRSKREAAASDPHQRVLLETAYHALESAGYFGPGRQQAETHDPDSHTTGCFIGMSAPDHVLHLASNPHSPYTGLGMMRSFVAGRLSHFFGWTGPSQTIDTACSSAMVAIHQACRAIQVGECTQAVAGGVHLLLNMESSDALHASGFTSETGICKAFDSRADGYCRGEGVGVLILKPLARALEDGDGIHGVLLATDVLGRAGVDPADVSYVEAHGTGTRAGDPVEIQGIREVFGGKIRSSFLNIGAVKANVSHTEGASGVVSLIKVLLMMKHGKIPGQAELHVLNPHIPALEPDRMAIPTSQSEWRGKRLAVVNNYGASGNNASAVVAPPPHQQSSPSPTIPSASAWPVFISAASRASLLAYCSTLSHNIIEESLTPELFPHMSFALATRQNRQLQHIFCTSANLLSDIQSQLTDPQKQIVSSPEPKPVVLLFSGQNGDNVPSAGPLYESSLLFRTHLHRCEDVVHSLGLPSLFPVILKGIRGGADLILRHISMFAIQYSCGMSWIDSGVKPQALCGHSLGEWAALTVSGAITLEAGIKIVSGYGFNSLTSSLIQYIDLGRTNDSAGRAAIIQRLWGDDPGSMVAIEADLVGTDTTPESHLETFYQRHPEIKLDIACYNGPNNYVVAGATKYVDVLESYLVKKKSSGEKLRFKVLRGMYAYHSSMADTIVNECGKLSASIQFQDPRLPFESCHEGAWTGPELNVIARNTRQPVYFGQAMSRIVDRLGACTFLEAGVNGPIVAMARSALPQALAQGPHTFLALNGKDLVRSLADATVTLWKTGQTNVQYWLFHATQRASYRPVALPPYHFEKHRHWLEYTGLPGRKYKNTSSDVPDHHAVCPHCQRDIADPPFIRRDKTHTLDTSNSDFIIDMRSRRYQDLVKGHVVVGTAICPAAVYLELAAHAVALLLNNKITSSIVVDSVHFKAPLSMDTQRSVKLTLTNKEQYSWGFEFNSTKDARLTVHAVGSISLKDRNNEGAEEEQGKKDKWARMIHLLEKDPDTDALRGAMIYKVFSNMVKHAAAYRGLRHLAGKGTEGAADISIPVNDLDTVARTPNDNVVDSLVMNNFLEVPGAYINCLHNFGNEDDSKAYICTSLGSVGPLNRLPDGRDYRAYAQIARQSANEAILDVLAFDAQTMELVLSAKDIKFSGISTSTLTKLLAGVNLNSTIYSDIGPSRVTEKSGFKQLTNPAPATNPKISEGAKANSPDVFKIVQGTLSQTLDVPVAEVTLEASLEELGVDSLISSEILASIHDALRIKVSVDDLAAATDVAALCELISSRVGGTATDTVDQGEEFQGSDHILETAKDEDLDWQKTAIKILGQYLDVPVGEISMDSQLEDLGADSLIAAEIASNINEALNLTISSIEFASLTDVRSFCGLIAHVSGRVSTQAAAVSPSGSNSAVPNGHPTTATEDKNPIPTKDDANLVHAAFQKVRRGFDSHAKEVNLTGFWDKVYPRQLSTVTAYILEAFEKLGCSFLKFGQGERLPRLRGTLPRYQREVSRLWEILEEAGVVEKQGDTFVRGPVPRIQDRSAKELSTELVSTFPQYGSTHNLLDLLGPQLADCLTGKSDATSILHDSDKGRKLLENFYTNDPGLLAAKHVLRDLFSTTMQAIAPGEPFRVLEIGAGFGSTAKHLLPQLRANGLPFTYTLSDPSATLLERAKTTFQDIEGIEFREVNVKKDPPVDLLGRYHIVISSSYAHGTCNLQNILANIRNLVRPNDGCVVLIEPTQKLAWYDLVWGLLDGWWQLYDGRTHALQSPWAWETALHNAGFAHVDWSESSSRESRTIRVICGMAAEPERKCPAEATSMLLHRGTSACGKRNLFLAPDGFGSGAVFGSLGPLLSSVRNVSVYALNSPFMHSNPYPDDPLTIEELAAIYVGEIKRRQPEGPYLLGGYSVGGVLAFEVARQLFEDGNDIEKLFLIDTACPTFVRYFPDALVRYLDSIEQVRVGNGSELRPNRRGRLVANDHFCLARQQMRAYQVRRLPGRKIPLVVLIAAKEGADKQNDVPRPVFLPEDQKAVKWFLDDRTDEGWFGWNEVLDNIKVVRADGNHFSMMLPSMISSWGVELARMLEE